MVCKNLSMNDTSVIVGDCREVLKTFPDKSFCLTITSPPYNMNLRCYNGEYAKAIPQVNTTAGVNPEKYDGYEDCLSMKEWYELNVDVITELLRVSDYVFYNVQMVTGNKPALWRLFGKFHKHLKEVIIWDKVNGQPAASEGVMNSRFEYILVFASDPEDGKMRQFKEAAFNKGTLDNVWRLKSKRSVDAAHKATFPVELASKIIECFYYGDKPILDPFCGTGSTGVAARLHGIVFKGIELLPKYASLAEKRIKGTVTGSLFNE